MLLDVEVKTVFEGGMRWELKLSWGEFEDFIGN